MTEKQYGKKIDDIDDNIIVITDNGNDFAWFLNDVCTDEQVDKIVDLLNKLEDENRQLRVELGTHKHPLWSTREAERIVNELKQENKRLKQVIIDKEVEWLRNNTVWEQMPTSKRTVTKTTFK